MDPLLTNEIGINVNTSFDELRSFQPKAAVQNATHDRLHRVTYAEQIKPGQNAEYKVAFPNDRAKSIAPFNREEKFKTLFTGIDRYNYVDPDYAYTDAEMKQIESHKLIYKKYLNEMRFDREEKLRNKEHVLYNNPADIGLKLGGGVKPQHLTLTELHQETMQPSKFQVNPEWQLITSEELSNQEKLLLKTSKENGTGAKASLG